MDDLKLQLEQSQQERKNLDLQIKNIPAIRDSSYLQEIDLLKKQIELFRVVQNYNLQLEFLDKIEVSEPEESKSQRMNGFQLLPVFQLKNRGEYWIINSNYLVPEPKLTINYHSYQNISINFECRNYRTSKDSTHNIILIKPAQVAMIDNSGNWQLTERGIIEFIDIQGTGENAKSEIPKINKQLDDFKLQIEQFQEECKSLESQIGKIAVLRDYVYLQIDLMKVRLESLEDKRHN